MNTELKYSEQITEATKLFKTFGSPERVYCDGEDITDEINRDFGGVDSWLRRLVVAFNNFHITSFAMSRINGVAKLYVRTIY